MLPRYGVHEALKNAKAEIFYIIFFNAGIGKLKYKCVVQNIKINTELPLGEVWSAYSYGVDVVAID
jgi:hypothetical protein